MDFIDIIGTFFDNSVEHVVALAQLIKDLRLNKNQLDINEDIYDLINNVTKESRIKDRCKGYFDHYYSLILNVPFPHIGDWAIVKKLDDGKWYIYKCVVEGYWKETTEEYTPRVELIEYAKKNELKTINGQSIVGEGNLEIGHYDPANSQLDGLMSSENYVSLLTIKNESIPQIRQSIDHILALFDDEESTETIQAILDRYSQIAEFVTSLRDRDNGLILYDILRDIGNFLEFITTIEEHYLELRLELTDVKDDNTRIHIILDLILDRLDTIENRIHDIEEIRESIVTINENIQTINENIEALDERITEVDNSTQETLLNIDNYIHNNVEQALSDITLDIGNSIEEVNGNLLDLGTTVEGIDNSLNDLSTTVEGVNSSLGDEIIRAQGAEEELNQRIALVEQNPAGIKHVILRLIDYESLESYEQDTLYIILANLGSHFGDKFPLIFGESYSSFGDKFPLIFK